MSSTATPRRPQPATPKSKTISNSHSIGMTLADTLDSLINDQAITPQLAMKVMQTFDQVIASVLGEKVKCRMTMKGHLDTYRFCDEVYTLVIKGMKAKLDNSTFLELDDKVKIVSCQSKAA